MKKVLFIATVDSHILNFHVPYLKWFKEEDFKVHVASNGNSAISFVDVKYNIPFERSPYKIKNFKAYKQLKKIIAENGYKVIHCHTPMGGVLTRLAVRKERKKGTKVLYTAHGFHFYKGAPLKNWLFYYPIEKWLSKYTDCLITINKEDYEIANSFWAKSVRHINGVGVDLNKFAPQAMESKIKLRKQYGFNNDDFILFFAAELNYNKHQDLLLKVVTELKDKIPQIKLLLAGNGDKKEFYKELAENLNVEKYVYFLGHRNDVPNLLSLADVAVSSSRREGLPVNVMEAMAVGLPLVVTNCRGNRDLVRDGENGYVVEIDDVSGFVNAIERLYRSKELRRRFSGGNIDFVRKYALDSILSEMAKIYKKYIL
jgi:glycosyltransferase EpsD